MPKTFAILGAAGKVGSATASALRRAGVPVRAILRDETKAAPLQEMGCEIVLADLKDSRALAIAIGDADSVQVILPPVPTVDDTARQMRDDIECLARALEEAQPARVLAISDYGAHVTHDIGMPTVFREFERRISQVKGHKVFLRSAEHMQIWARSIPTALASGTLPSFKGPVDMLFPTISAPDLGLIAADILLRPLSDKEIEVVHAEGPHRYSPNDVAETLSELLGATIKAEAVPRSEWKGLFERTANTGLADLLIKANEASNSGGLVDVESSTHEVRYGRTELADALRPFLPQR